MLSLQEEVFLNMTSSEAPTSRDHVLIKKKNLSHELWCSVMSACLFTEVKRQWAI